MLQGPNQQSKNNANIYNTKQTTLFYDIVFNGPIWHSF
jgi:hypothetical protein